MRLLVAPHILRPPALVDGGARGAAGPGAGGSRVHREPGAGAGRGQLGGTGEALRAGGGFPLRCTALSAEI